MAKVHRIEISIDGADFAPGHLIVENGSWHGAVEGQRMPGGERLRVIALSGGHIYAGKAMITHLNLPTQGSAKPVNEFQGDGPISRRTIDEIAEWLSSSADGGERRG